jgi:hypothetical protein
LCRNRRYCTLISIDLRFSYATYLDSGSNEKKKDYTNVRAVLDNALTGYIASGGTTRRPVVKTGKHVFTHVMNFPCVKQPAGSAKDAYYALYHMEAYLRDEQNLRLPESLRRWGQDLSTRHDDEIRESHYRIQTRLCTIIWHDVVMKGVSFYYSVTPPNSEMDALLEMQLDDRQLIMTDAGVPMIRAREPTRKKQS